MTGGADAHEPYPDNGHDHDAHDHHDHDHALIVDRLPEGDWRVDPDSSEVHFRARALFGLLPVHGLFERFDGELRVDRSGAAAGALTVDAGSIESGLARRDSRLRSSEFLDVATHPRMTFTLERIEPSGHDHLNVGGTLELCGRRIPLSLEAYAIAHGDHLHLEGRVIIDHGAAGLGWTRPGLVSKRVRAEAALTLTRAQ